MKIGRKREGGKSHRELNKKDQCMLTADGTMLLRSRQWKYKMLWDTKVFLLQMQNLS